MPMATDIDLGLTVESVRRFPGLRFSGRFGPRVRGLVPEIFELAETEGLIQPALAYDTWTLAVAEGASVRLANGGGFEGAAEVVAQFGRAEALAVTMGTIGGAIDDRINALFAERQPMKGLVLEEIAVMALGRLRTVLHERVQADAAERELEASAPLDPGCHGFDIANQAALFALAGAQRIGIRLTDSMAMFPSKSLSMVFGIGHDMPDWSQADACTKCRARDRCRHRRLMTAREHP